MQYSLLNASGVVAVLQVAEALTRASVRRIWVEPLATQNMQIMRQCRQISGQAAGLRGNMALMADKDPRWPITIAPRRPRTVRGSVEGGGEALLHGA